ncbi:hypothetical protein BDV98DRAFT_13216 [Pterulicium gracile]|uniref:Uncharacterized protein n=1 Tax=Pterulicium gracile TaxID=1884261 RepID=A0A5C3QYT4_9AGAR|nr:hypothetical protein BDV98DRAFT_13216 [Pterula gracilis]
MQIPLTQSSSIARWTKRTLVDLVTTSSAFWDDAAAFSKLINEEAAKPHPKDQGSQSPLWRVVLCKDSTVVFSYHPGIGDGKSGLAFHTMVLQALNSQDHSSPVESRELAPAIENCIDVSTSWTKLLWEIASMVLPSSWQASHSTWTGNPVPALNTALSPSERGRPYVTLLEFSPTDVSRLLTSCSKHNATIT